MAVEQKRASISGRLGMVLFLASEAMFFIGLVGAFLVLRSGQPVVFERSVPMLNPMSAILGVVLLIGGSVALSFAAQAARNSNSRRLRITLVAALVLGAGFLAVTVWQYRALCLHHTIAMQDGAVYDGRIVFSDRFGIDLVGERVNRKAGEPFDIHVYLPSATVKARYQIPRADVVEDVWYGPFKNNFFGCFYVLTGAHGVHVVAAIVALLIILGLSVWGRVFPIAIENLALFWHFLVMVEVFLFPLLYWGGRT